MLRKHAMQSIMWRGIEWMRRDWALHLAREWHYLSFTKVVMICFIMRFILFISRDYIPPTKAVPWVDKNGYKMHCMDCRYLHVGTVAVNFANTNNSKNNVHLKLPLDSMTLQRQISTGQYLCKQGNDTRSDTARRYWNECYDFHRDM